MLRKQDNASPTSAELQKALRKMGGSARNISITEDQQIDLVRNHVRSKWWGKGAMFFVNMMPPSVVKRRLKIWRFITAMLLILLLLAVAGFYFVEMYTFGQLSAEDRVTYRHCILHMRQADFRKLAFEVVKAQDPDGFLPYDEQMSLVAFELRKRGLDKLDFEMEYRTRDSVLEELDWMHIIYHLWLEIAKMVLLCTPYSDGDAWVEYGGEVKEGRVRESIGAPRKEELEMERKK